MSRLVYLELKKNHVAATPLFLNDRKIRTAKNNTVNFNASRALSLISMETYTSS
jgi:hypothetical protein